MLGASLFRWGAPIARRLGARAARLPAVLVLAVSGMAASLAAPLDVVASFSVLGDMVNEVGGDHVSVTTIVGPDGDAHSFEPRPEDAKALAQARILFVNGLDFEAWLPRLVQASDFKGVEVVASKGVKARLLTSAEQALEARDGRGGAPDGGHAHHGHADGRGEQARGTHTQHIGGVDPHAWQSLTNGMLYVRNISAALAQVDPARGAEYQARAKAYIARMTALDTQVRKALAVIPDSARKVVTSHDAFGYFGQAYDVQFIAAAGISNDAEPSARDVAGLIDQIRKEHIPAVFIENITNPRLMEQISRETGAKVGGTLYSDALAQPDQPAGTYLGMFKWNAGQLIFALQEGAKAH